MKTKINSACKNDGEFFEGQGCGFGNQENSNKKAMVLNLQNRDGQIRQSSLDVENFQKKYQINVENRQNKGSVLGDENVNAKYFPTSKLQGPPTVEAQNCEQDSKPQEVINTGNRISADRNQASTPEKFNRSKSQNIPLGDQANQKRAQYMARLEKDCLGRRNKREGELQNMEQSFKRTPKHSQKGDSSFVNNNQCDRSFSNWGDRRQLAVKRHGELDKQVREKRKLHREIKKLERSGMNDYLQYKDKRDIENQSYLEKNTTKLESFNNSQVQAQIQATESFLLNQKSQKENDKRTDNQIISVQVSKERQKYEESYQKWELKSRLYGTELQKQILDQKLKVLKNNCEDKSFVTNFVVGGKTPEKLTSYNRPNKILQGKFRNYSDIMKDKENCAKRSMTPKPRVAAGASFGAKKVVQKKVDIGKNLVAKDLYNELRFQITGKN